MNNENKNPENVNPEATAPDAPTAPAKKSFFKSKVFWGSLMGVVAIAGGVTAYLMCGGNTAAAEA